MSNTKYLYILINENQYNHTVHTMLDGNDHKFYRSSRETISKAHAGLCSLSKKLTSGTGEKSVRFKSIEKWSSQNHQILE